MTSKSSIIKHDYIKDEVDSSSEKEAPKPTQDYLKHIDQLPDPVGYRMLLKMWKMSEMTDGGIALSEQTLETSEITSVVGYVVKQGSLCYKDKEKFPEGPWCREKDWVIFARYAGSRFRIEGGEVRILNDDEILATIDNPDDILSL